MATDWSNSYRGCIAFENPSGGVLRDKALWDNWREDSRRLGCNGVSYSTIVVGAAVLVKLVSVGGLISVLLT